MSAPAAESGVTRRQTLDALDDMAWKDIPQPWHAVLTRARSLAYELTGLGAALDAIDALYIRLIRTTPGPRAAAWTPNGCRAPGGTAGPARGCMWRWRTPRWC
jgi:hypothetical protein